MRELLIVIGLLCLAVALRSSRTGLVRKAGALLFLVASFFLFYFLSGCLSVGFLGASLWFFLPWIELLTRIRRMRLPLENRLHHTCVPNPSFFPNAEEAAAGMDEAGFEHVSDCGWEWAGMHQFFRLFWHPEERAVAALCLCEQSDVAFAFVSITSQDCQGHLWRTTNFPFSSTLKCPPTVHWNHVSCKRATFQQLLNDHRAFLARAKVPAHRLRIPDPEQLEIGIEQEMRQQVAYNLDSGLIRLTGDGHFQYSKRGLLFLWGQFIKDMLRLC